MLDGVFSASRKRRRLAFIAYVMAGDPDLSTTEQLLPALTQAGADILELGVPYSDPLADGPSIASAGMRALQKGTRMHDVIDVVHRVASKCSPIVLFSYFNPIDRFGIDRFVEAVAGAGAAGAIVPDLALEESARLREAMQRCGLAMPLLVAPSTSRERAARIVAASTGFVYVVSRFGVTGAPSAPHLGSLKAQLGMLRELTASPLAVGFGIRGPDDVRALAADADAAVVGSALIDAYARCDGAEAVRRVSEFVAPLIAATASA